MVFVPANDGRWINENFARLAEIIQDYDINLELRWIPPENRTRDDKKPYVIWDIRCNKPVLFACELDSPVEILARLYDADNKHGNVLKRLEASNKAIEDFKKKEQQDAWDDAHDQAKFLWTSPLNYVKFNGKKFDDQRRVLE
jgi:hypothetical protein